MSVSSPARGRDVAGLSLTCWKARICGGEGFWTVSAELLPLLCSALEFLSLNLCISDIKFPGALEVGGGLLLEGREGSDDFLSWTFEIPVKRLLGALSVKGCGTEDVGGVGSLCCRCWPDVVAIEALPT